ncbi:MAG: fumarylacetoacetate hydrolase family protein [Ilumatobacteraceae bacterium]
MRLATVRIDGHLRAARIDGPAPDGTAILLDASDVGALLAGPDWRARASAAGGASVATATLDYAPLVPQPDKIICVGLNYRSHILEMGRAVPEFPTVFAKYRGALIGAHDDIVLPAVSDMVDWEAELTVVIGAPIRHGDRDAAAAAIAGYTVLNDVSARDWQSRTIQFLQGKTFESSTPVGPWLVTADEPGAAPGPDQRIGCTVDGEVMQDASTGDLLFDPVTLVAYLSQVITLLPGDLIATGTPGGVGSGRTPPRFLEDGQEVVTTISGLGVLRNRCRREVRPH